MQTHPSRRTVLRAAGGLGAGALLAGCTAQAPPAPPQVVVPPDPLVVLAVAARADAAAAASAAPTTPAKAVVLATVAAERRAHADALDAEIARAAGSVDGTPLTPPPPATTPAAATPPGSTPAAATPPGSTPAAAPPAASTPPVTPPATLAQVVAALTANQRTAAAAAIGAPPYRAGLLGSVAAACAAELAVLA